MWQDQKRLFKESNAVALKISCNGEIVEYSYFQGNCWWFSGVVCQRFIMHVYLNKGHDICLAAGGH